MKNKHRHILHTFLFGTFIISSCQITTITQNTTESGTYKDNAFTAATIIDFKLDGCSWMLELENGKKLQPLNLKSEFQKNDLKVWVKYTIKKVNGICMAGETVDITEIELRK
jgi:hypothetical protein